MKAWFAKIREKLTGEKRKKYLLAGTAALGIAIPPVKESMEKPSDAANSLISRERLMVFVPTSTLPLVVYVVFSPSELFLTSLPVCV